MTPEEIKPYGPADTRDKGEQVREMFDTIAPAYDLMNRAMTLGLDRWWRRLAVNRVRDHGGDYLLDVATGTGDLAVQLARRVDPVGVTGVDLSERMLEKARRKVAEADLSETVKFYRADCMHLPIPDGGFDAATVAFGVRNFASLPQGLAELARVLKPGGLLVVLELSVPRGRLVRRLYDFYAGRVIPLAGRLVSRDRRAYSYLPESIAALPDPDDMARMMEDAGLECARWRPLTLGVCTLYTARKPQGHGKA